MAIGQNPAQSRSWSHGAARPGLTLVATCLGLFLSQVDTTAINLALPAMSRDLGGGIGAMQWAIDVYNIAFAALLLTGGTLGDRFGRRRLQVETQGRHRYYRLAGDDVGELLEQLARMAPTHPVRSLREGSRAQQLRAARTCYDHLAGRLGVSLMAALLELDCLKGGDGLYRPGQQRADRLSAYGRDVEYALTPTGWDFLADLGVQIPEGNRSLVRYCVDRSEQRHHVAGLLGRGLLDTFLTESWIQRRKTGRCIQVTEAGAAVLGGKFGIDWDESATTNPWPPPALPTFGRGRVAEFVLAPARPRGPAGTGCGNRGRQDRED